MSTKEIVTIVVCVLIIASQASSACELWVFHDVTVGGRSSWVMFIKIRPLCSDVCNVVVVFQSLYTSACGADRVVTMHWIEVIHGHSAVVGWSSMATAAMLDPWIHSCQYLCDVSLLGNFTQAM